MSENNPSSPESGATPASSPAQTDLRQELDSVRNLAMKLQSALIALTVLFGLFIFVQFWRTNNELSAVRKAVTEAKLEDARIGQFISQLVEYSRTHPDFVPIISKYPIGLPQQNAPAPSGGAAPKPAAPANAPANQPRR
jgi:hypothetical protein